MKNTVIIATAIGIVATAAIMAINYAKSKKVVNIVIDEKEAE